MEILSLDIRWWHGYMNQPECTAIVDKIPPLSESLWHAVPDKQARRHTHIISTNQPPILRFKHIGDPTDAPNIGGALGGSHVMTTGDVFKSSCGWSSRVGVINRDFYDYLPGGEEYVEVPLKEKDGLSVYYAGLSLPVSLVKAHLPKGVYLVRTIMFGDEPYWIPSTVPNKVVKPKP